ncbi:hypothetical protein PM082_015572 [Marasmius tenuissimus]|nr:hypothetical protein PM082_015572 [Marasmius tenuissimus]
MAASLAVLLITKPDVVRRRQAPGSGSVQADVFAGVNGAVPSADVGCRAAAVNYGSAGAAVVEWREVADKCEVSTGIFEGSDDLLHHLYVDLKAIDAA